MGWFSDMMFGKKKKMNIDKMNEFYKPYASILNQQGDIANQMLDPNSLLNMQRQGMLRNQQADMTGMQNQQTMKFGAMSGMSPGQIIANTAANSSRSRGELGMQFNNLLTNQYDKGLGLLGNVGMQQLGEGDRLTDRYLGGLTAHNTQIDGRKQFALDAGGLFGQLTGMV